MLSLHDLLCRFLKVCKYVCCIFQSHVVESSQPGRVGAAAVLEFWVGILTQQNLWYRDKTVLFLMDQICCAAFTHTQEQCVQKLLYQQHKVLILLDVCIIYGHLRSHKCRCGI